MMTEESNEPNDIRISKDEIDFIRKRIKEQDEARMRAEIEEQLKQKNTTQTPPTDTIATDEILKLKEENEKLRQSHKAILLNQFTEEEQEKYKDKSNADLELLLDYKKDYKPKGIVFRASDKSESNKETKDELPPGMIGRFDFKKQKYIRSD